MTSVPTHIIDAGDAITTQGDAELGTKFNGLVLFAPHHGSHIRLMNADNTLITAPGTHEFIRRFLLHGLPDGFHRIRHYGFLANGHWVAKIAVIRQLLDQVPPQAIHRSSDYRERLHDLMGIDLSRCPYCGGPMLIIATLPRSRSPPSWSPQNDKS